MLGVETITLNELFTLCVFNIFERILPRYGVVLVVGFESCVQLDIILLIYRFLLAAQSAVTALLLRIEQGILFLSKGQIELIIILLLN